MLFAEQTAVDCVTVAASLQLPVHTEPLAVPEQVHVTLAELLAAPICAGGVAGQGSGGGGSVEGERRAEMQEAARAHVRRRHHECRAGTGFGLLRTPPGTLKRRSQLNRHGAGRR